MTSQYLDIETISGLHDYVGAPRPKHPLISLIDNTRFYAQCPRALTAFRFGFYTISCKRIHGVLKYGKGHYDFSEGSLMFTAPWQVITGNIDEGGVEEGWALFIHPDLLNATELGKKMHRYSFFNYDVNEALHISDDEKEVIRDCVAKIEREYSQNIDKHTLRLITGNIELLLNYCDRFYDRQFYTRAMVSNDVVQHFERLLNGYFEDTLIDKGLPTVKYFASELSLSPNYLSDLLNRFTGKTTQEHIHLRMIDKAKSLLWGTERSISEIAYELGFEHPSHFTKIFKTKTGKSPSAFRNLN